jgi:hypothetical protein
MPSPFKKPTKKTDLVSKQEKREQAKDSSNSLLTSMYDRWHDEPEMKALNLAVSYSNTFDVDKQFDALMELFNARQVQKLVGRGYTFEELEEHSLHETAIRSKVVGIHLKAMNYARRIEACRDTARKTIAVEDLDWISQQVSNKGERSMLTEVLLSEAEERLADFKMIIDACILIVGTIDKTDLVLNRVARGLELENKPERRKLGSSKHPRNRHQ